MSTHPSSLSTRAASTGMRWSKTVPSISCSLSMLDASVHEAASTRRVRREILMNTSSYASRRVREWARVLVRGNHYLCDILVLCAYCRSWVHTVDMRPPGTDPDLLSPDTGQCCATNRHIDVCLTQMLWLAILLLVNLMQIVATSICGADHCGCMCPATCGRKDFSTKRNIP